MSLLGKPFDFELRLVLLEFDWASFDMLRLVELDKRLLVLLGFYWLRHAPFFFILNLFMYLKLVYN